MNAYAIKIFILQCVGTHAHRRHRRQRPTHAALSCAHASRRAHARARGAARARNVAPPVGAAAPTQEFHGICRAYKNRRPAARKRVGSARGSHRGARHTARWQGGRRERRGVSRSRGRDRRLVRARAPAQDAWGGGALLAVFGAVIAGRRAGVPGAGRPRAARGAASGRCVTEWPRRRRWPRAHRTLRSMLALTRHSCGRAALARADAQVRVDRKILLVRA